MAINVNTKRELDEAEAFHILGNDRRRAAIKRLAQSSGSITVSELAERIAEEEADSTAEAEDLYKSVYVSLRQTHLPKLASQGIIEYDPGSQTIHPGTRMDEIRVYTSSPSRFEALQRSAYLLVSLVGLLAVVGAQFGVPGFGFLPVEVWAVFFLLLIVGLSLYQSYT
ncbi:DUF7344 domain-containing protein [Halegenticoccus tardaugens]|uniref:DUF7344 domain-containing protein n=1 Tax=Halegenticoccus tardaugens TaxID=2071624 RepID=UPI00100A2632|nr:ArsR family transcriptional regulator [Halegenticoccus tardaugens]